jgi:two-component system sensor histidine kinase KdpD
VRVAWLLSPLVVVGVTLLGLALRTAGLRDPAMLYLLGIMVSAIWLGRGPSVLASALSVVAFDFFFVPPHFTLSIDDWRYLLTFGTMFGTGLVISTLTIRLREQEQRAVRARTEEMRGALLSAVSHDLRTPLATITGSATALRDPALPPDVRADLIESLCEEAARLERLVANILDMTRLQAGVVPKREWVPVEELVGSALSRSERQLAGREVAVSLPPNLSMVPVDPVLVEQLLINLLDNAAKHTPAGTKIELSAAARSKAVELVVADRGPGVAPSDGERIFDRFYRGSGAVQAPGAGLGLAICRAIAEAHGGTIRATNREGGGASFQIVLPIVGEPPAPPPTEEAA